MTTPEDLAADVESLWADGASPARCRTVASRAYYAAYHRCLAAATDAGYVRQPGGGGTHQQLISYLTAPGQRRFNGAGRRLKEMYGLRIDADYDLETPMDGTLVQESLEAMTEIIEALRPG